VGEVEDTAEGAPGVLDVERFHGPKVTEPTRMRHEPSGRRANARGTGFAVAPAFDRA
jgi:hypothetical protein